MSTLSDTVVDGVATAVETNLDAIAHSLKSCFGEAISLAIGGQSEYRQDALPTDPGVLIVLRMGSQGLVFGIPASLPLPRWYLSPGESDEARLQTLAMECSLNLVPEDCIVEDFVAKCVDDLSAAVATAQPAANARSLELLVRKNGLSLPVIWPVDHPEVYFAKGGSRPVSDRSRSTQPPVEHDYLRKARSRLGKVKVTVSVRLAEKRIELGQLLAVNPGALITFNKSCEDLLDLYVNNSLYCRGEAVKIGEKFGLKVNDIPHRQPNHR